MSPINLWCPPSGHGLGRARPQVTAFVSGHNKNANVDEYHELTPELVISCPADTCHQSRRLSTAQYVTWTDTTRNDTRRHETTRLRCRLASFLCTSSPRFCACDCDCDCDPATGTLSDVQRDLDQSNFSAYIPLRLVAATVSVLVFTASVSVLVFTFHGRSSQQIRCNLS